MISEKILENAGLTRIEAKVYLVLLNLGPSQAGEITKRSSMHRRTVYDVLDRLAEKGLISYIIKNNRKLFQATNPNRLIEIINEKGRSISETLPALQELFTKTRKKEETNFFKGKNGLKSVFEDQIEEGKEILVLGASPEADKILQFYFKWFNKRRVDKKIKAKFIFARKKEKQARIPFAEVRCLPEKYSGPAATNIYGDKVAIILWSKENPLAIVIKNKEIAESYKKFFDLMWIISKK